VDELKVEFCPIMRSRTNEEKSIQGRADHRGAEGGVSNDGL
jgi:hypothetical protein